MLLPKEDAELYAEFCRNNHSGNRRDLALEPEHSRAYLIGFRKLFETGKNNETVELMAELTNLQIIPSTIMLRAQKSWYAHYQIGDGYTNQGQMVGAGIGPGGSSQTVSLSRIKGLNKAGLLLERVVHNNGFYYDAFTPTQNFFHHWIDLSAGINKSRQCRSVLYHVALTYVKSLHYEWALHEDRNNFQARFSVLYRF